MAKPRFTQTEHIIPTREVLAKRFPLAFMPKGSRTKVPLKVGIVHDILQHVKDIDRELLKRAVADYCSGPKYAKAMVAGAQRIDLDGKPAGIVSTDQEAFAKAKEAKRRENALLYHARRQTEREARRLGSDFEAAHP